MASEVDICNLALGHLGDAATVASLNPPEGSAQAEHCARFYPIARNSLLEMAPWGFATRRIALAAVDNPSSTWLYAYAMPANVVNVLSVLPSNATDDYEGTVGAAPNACFPGFLPINPPSAYMPQRFSIESDSRGNQLILTNQPSAVLRYTTLVTDTTKFSPLFVTSLSWLLASMLAGPIIKGDTGAAEAKRCYAMFQVFEAQAEASDANQSKQTVQPVVSWIAGR